MAAVSRATTSGRGSISRDPHDAVALGGQPVDEALDLRLDLLGVRGAGAQDELHLGRELGGRAQEEREPLLAGDPSDEDDARAVGVDAQLAHPSRVLHRLPVVGVDAVVHDVHPRRGRCRDSCGGRRRASRR